ncbi:hypothetical protein [Puniceicoccus vermicola]|uniref:DUF4380 domain-containing protein n=1 Tax=Puniceicoccus vermicola TaxID=388746 RepID=A0A7X1E607_9BACT|nr:hypothetical protein [Puniceicoccus vermicola]MBC2602152.1 hypothetical protein [Puniceicoccus vermicola]
MPRIQSLFILRSLCGCLLLLTLWGQSRGEEIVLGNGKIEVAVDPAKGRIMHLSLPGLENLLWINPDAEKHFEEHGWQQWGGDRMLVTPIALWPQIYGSSRPDPEVNDLPWEVLEKGDAYVRLRSAQSEVLGVQVERMIQLVEGEAVVRQSYVVRKIAESPIPVHVWTLTHFPVQGTIWMNIAEDTLHNGIRPLRNFFIGRQYVEGRLTYPEADRVEISMPDEHPIKVGTFGGWIAWKNDGFLFWIEAEWNRDGLYFDGSNLQIYINPRPGGFIEVESQSPTRYLEVGESVEFETRMGIEDVSAEERASVKKVLQGLQGE